MLALFLLDYGPYRPFYLRSIGNSGIDCELMLGWSPYIGLILAGVADRAVWFAFR